MSLFIEELKDGIKKGYDNFELDFSQVRSVFPNAATPIAGIIDHHRSAGIEFEYNARTLPPNVGITKIHKPLSLPKDEAVLNKNALNKVWRFQGSSEIKQIVDAYIAELRKEARFESGALKAIEWSIYEVMDNVIQHSQSDCGYIMGQLHGSSKNIAFTIFDIGQGIYNSLKESEHRPRTPVDALTICIKEEVTRDKSVGQGNGLFGLFSVVKQGAGRLALTSGGGSYMYDRGRVRTFPKIPPVLSYKQPGTIIDFQLNYASGISLENALKFRGVPNVMVDFFVENLEDEHGAIQYKIMDHAEGTGTRESAIRVKNEIFNILTETRSIIILDFSGVGTISSSFADELIAKMMIEMGFFQFNSLIRLKGMDMTLQAILQRSVLQRIATEMKNSTSPKSQS